MKRSVKVIVKLLLISILLASCAAPVEETTTETSIPTEMAAMETSTSTETMEAAVSSTATLEATASSTETLEAMDDSSSLSEDIEVEIENFAYVSAVVTVKAGTTVTWTNKDNVQHTVTSDNGLFDSGLFAKGNTFSFTFTEAGIFTYHCTPHPNMKGTIIVE